MLDQLIIGDKSSLDDFGASVAQRSTPPPKKKEIKETVPLSNVTYDFSKIDGELYWEQRELEYIFEIFGNTPEDLEQKKAAFLNWVMNVFEENIIDPYRPDFHFVGTYADNTPEDDEGMDKTTITVKFAAYPYAVANRPKVYAFSIPAASSITATILNDSSHRITPTITTDEGITLQMGNDSYSVPAGETTDDNFKFVEGLNEMILSNPTETDCAVTVLFYEEVF